MMKGFVIIALLATAVLVSSLPDSKVNVHIHLDHPVKINRVNGMVSKLIKNAVNKNNSDVEFHLHVDQLDLEDMESVEDFDFGDIIGGIVKGFDVLKQGINVAIDKANQGFDRVKYEIQSIRLPPINIPNLVTPVIQLAKVASNMIPCALALKNVLPNLISFAKAAGVNNASEAVLSLMRMLPYMPDITSKCIGKAFQIPPRVMSKIQCSADIVALAAIVTQFILLPENVIGNINGLKSMIELIPATISDCTSAFK